MQSPDTELLLVTVGAAAAASTTERVSEGMILGQSISIPALRSAEGTAAGEAAGLESRQRETSEEAALLVAAAAMMMISAEAGRICWFAPDQQSILLVLRVQRLSSKW